MCILVLQDRATSAERALVAAWREAAPENARWFRNLEAVWSATAEPRLSVFAERPDPDAILREVAQRAASSGNRSGEGGKVAGAGWFRRLVPLAAAASVAVLFGGYLAYQSWVAPVLADAPSGVREIATGGDEMATVRLEDGTVVRLAPRSRLEFQEGTDRQVALEGRAFFGVAPDPDRPFRVRTAGGDALALGTRFEVGTRGSDLRVLVVDGTVELRTGERRVELGPRSLAEASGGGPATVREVEDVLPHLSWLGRSLVLRDTPFREALREMEDRFGVRVRFEAPELEERRITASFTDEALEEVLRVVCRVVRARCTLSGDLILVAPREPSVPSRTPDGFDRRR